MGRSRIRATPSSTYSPRPSVSMAARNRIVVPELPQSSAPAGWSKPVPVTDDPAALDAL